MKFKLKREQLVDKHRWHYWFAWYPVKGSATDMWAWLEYVERIKRYQTVCNGDFQPVEQGVYEYVLL
jgi:putative component of toxin-antitoxin plasmid stabilization module